MRRCTSVQIFFDQRGMKIPPPISLSPVVQIGTVGTSKIEYFGDESWMVLTRRDFAVKHHPYV